MAKSLTIRDVVGSGPASWTAASVTDIDPPYPRTTANSSETGGFLCALVGSIAPWPAIGSCSGSRPFQARDRPTRLFRAAHGRAARGQRPMPIGGHVLPRGAG